MTIHELPRPYHEPALYKEVLEAGFNAFPTRKRNYLRYQNAQCNPKLDYLPIKLDIENVSRCNYRCTMCVVSDWPKQKRADDMSLQDFKNLIDAQEGLIEIKLQGLGEPLMGKSYFDMIRYARERHIWVRGITNGSLLHIKENYKKLIDSDICELHLSIDGASAQVYEKIRRGANFLQVEKNCIYLNSYAKNQGKLRTRMWCVVQKDNFDELEDIVKTAANWGFIRLTFSLELEDWGHEHWKIRNTPNDTQHQFTSEHARNLVSIGESLGVAVTFWSTYEKFDFTSLDKLCPWPFERAVVSSDMRIVPCCMVSEPAIFDLGDATRFSDEWNTEAYQEFRQSHIDGNLPKICKNCYTNNVDSMRKDWIVNKPDSVPYTNALEPQNGKSN